MAALNIIMSLSRAVFLMLKLFPKELATRVAGKIADARLPQSILLILIKLYSAIFGVNMKESEKPASEFKTFNEFFTRKLKSGARKINAAKNAVISPVDGTIINFGEIKKGTLIQAKGKYYALKSLLRDESAAKQFEAGSFITIYLHPRDYHRIHAPLSGKISGFSYIPGALFPVNALSLGAVDGLFLRNERLITYMETSAGKIAVVKIGACLVGRIRAGYAGFIADSAMKDGLEKKFARKIIPSHFDYGRKALQSSIANADGKLLKRNFKIAIKKGDELGAFELGSTVILLFRKKRIIFGRIKEGMKVRMGEKIAEVKLS